MFCFFQSDEELGGVCVPPPVCHGQYTGPRMLHVKVLILELVPIDGLSTSAILIGDVTSLSIKTRHLILNQDDRSSIY